jgi:hypothetical protein
MSTAIQLVSESRLPPVPWRDPQTVPPAKLCDYIRKLEAACEQNPESADLRTCLGMAYAMNFEAYKSMDALEAAREIAPDNFFAQLKYAELLYRLRILSRSEEETLKALDLANNGWEASLARKQLLEIRRLMREGTQKPVWTKSLTSPAISLLIMSVLLSLVVLWR